MGHPFFVSGQFGGYFNGDVLGSGGRQDVPSLFLATFPEAVRAIGGVTVLFF